MLQEKEVFVVIIFVQTEFHGENRDLRVIIRK